MNIFGCARSMCLWLNRKINGVLVITTKNIPYEYSRYRKEKNKQEVAAYNDHMSSIDRCDQMMATYATTRKTSSKYCTEVKRTLAWKKSWKQVSEKICFWSVECALKKRYDEKPVLYVKVVGENCLFAQFVLRWTKDNKSSILLFHYSYNFFEFL